MRNIILGFILIVLMSGVAAAQAFVTTGSPTDSASGTLITAEGTNTTIDYNDSQGTGLVTNDASDIEHTVDAEYGFSFLGSPADQTVTPGDLVTHETYYVTNEGNTSLTTGETKLRYDEAGGASGWIVEVWASGLWKTLEANTTTVETISTITEDEDSFFHYEVLVSSEAAGAPNGSSILLSTTIEVYDNPIGQYTGGNAYTYGGTSEASDFIADSVSAPFLTLTRTHEVYAPKNYTGGSHEAVPGAVIDFIMSYSNTGNASAASVIIIDKVPYEDADADGTPDTSLAHFNTRGDTTYVTLEVGGVVDGGGDWTLSYSTEESPDMSYAATTGWTIVGTLASNGSGSFPGGSNTWLIDSPEAEAKWVKWEKSYVATDEDGKTLLWGVTIR